MLAATMPARIARRPLDARGYRMMIRQVPLDWNLYSGCRSLTSYGTL